MPATTPLREDFLIDTEDDLRALYKARHPLAVKKCQPKLDPHSRAFIERSPFVCVGTQSAEGRADVSPRGDPAGFVKVLDDRTLLIPDRPGNNRLDSLVNLLENPSIGLLFMVPGLDDTMRVNGRARLSRDPDLLAMMAVQDRLPTIAVVVTVLEVFIHCAKAFRRSRLWDPDALQDRGALPSITKIILDQTTGAPEDPGELAQMNAALEDEYRKTLY